MMKVKLPIPTRKQLSRAMLSLYHWLQQNSTKPILLNWLEAFTQIHEQEIVACGSVVNQAVTSSNVEVDTQS